MDLSGQDDKDLSWHLSLLQEDISGLELSHCEFAEKHLLPLLRVSLQSNLRWKDRNKLLFTPILVHCLAEELIVDISLDTPDDSPRLGGTDLLNRVTVERVELPALPGGSSTRETILASDPTL